MVDFQGIDIQLILKECQQAIRTFCKVDGFGQRPKFMVSEEVATLVFFVSTAEVLFNQRVEATFKVEKLSIFVALLPGKQPLLLISINFTPKNQQSSCLTKIGTNSYVFLPGGYIEAQRVVPFADSQACS